MSIHDIVCFLNEQPPRCRRLDIYTINSFIHEHSRIMIYFIFTILIVAGFGQNEKVKKWNFLGIEQILQQIMDTIVGRGHS